MIGINKINLMILIVSMPVGGVENLILSIVQRLNKQKYNVMICCIKELGALGEKAAELGIKIIALNLMQSNRFSLLIPYRISRILKENNIHILWTHQYVANLYGRMASLVAKTPVVISTFHVLYDNQKFHRRIFNHLLSYKTDIMVSVSNAVAADMVRYDRVNPKKIKVIYNGIEQKRFDEKLSKGEARNILGLPHKGVIIGTLGRLTEQKGHRYLIEAGSNLGDTYIVIVGDGPLAGELREQAGRLKINCIFPGRLDYKQVPVFLRAVDIFCFPSLWEGFSIALIEAMAAGLPVVASDIPPHREVVGDAGMLVPVKDAARLAETLGRLIEEPSLRMTLGGRARERAKVFSIENTVKAYEDLFDEILQKKSITDAI